MSIKHGVSLYSYQENYYLGKLDLEGCVAAAKNAGADGIEVIPEQMPIGQYPYPTDAQVDHWFSLMDKYGVHPTCMDVFDDYTLYKNRTLRAAEKLDFLIDCFRRAKRLGFYILRNQNSLEIDVIEKAIPYAEEYGVKMGFEVHAPLMLQSERNEQLIELIEKTGTKYLTIVPDFGIFEKHASRVNVNKLIRQGTDEKIVEYLLEAGKNKVPQAEMMEAVRKMGASDKLIGSVRMYANHYNDPELLRTYAKYAVHFHGKFYEMDETCTETCIDYEGPIRVLKDMGWDGYISSEFEGQRAFHDIEMGEYYVDEVEQVRRHHEMIRRYAGE